MMKILMTEKEARRAFVMEKLNAGTWTVPMAAAQLGLSERQVQRLKKGFARSGEAALAHGARGKPSPRATPTPVEDKVVLLAKHQYKDGSYRHMAELLAERQHIHLSEKTVGRILKKAKVEHPHTRRRPRGHPSRAPAPRSGLLVQCDASHHDWLEGRGPWLVLHGLIDDAKGEVVGLNFAVQELTCGYFGALKMMISRVGCPATLYSDRHTLFVSPKTDKLSIEEQLEGKTVKLTQFGRALEQLGIRHSLARSPQAKGRIERLWGTLQNRLVLEMRLAGISTLEEANSFVAHYIDRHNQRFAHAAAEPELAWSPAPGAKDVERILCLQHERIASRGSTLSFGGALYQLQDGERIVRLAAKARIMVLEGADGSLSAVHRDRSFALVPFAAPERSSPPEEQDAQAPASKPKREPTKPAADHPWRRGWASRKLRDSQGPPAAQQDVLPP
jgi:transposase